MSLFMKFMSKFGVALCMIAAVLSYWLDDDIQQSTFFVALAIFAQNLKWEDEK